jgi:uncharacterized protein (TIGR00369 family)
MSTATVAEREYGVTPPEVLRRMSGLEWLNAVKDGQLPAAPIAKVLDFDLAEVGEGRAVFRGTPGSAVYNPVGAVHGGWIATLLDSAMACAVYSMLPAGQASTTLELKLNMLRGITAATGPVAAEGKLVHCGRRTGVAEGRLTDARGRLLAHGTTTCLIFDL